MDLLDIPLKGCYNIADNLITHRVAVGAQTSSAEQDNRVRIPDGTAAVCAEDRIIGESQSLEIALGRPIRPVGDAPQARVRRPTLWILPRSARYRVLRLSQKTGCGTSIGAAVFCF